MTESLSYTHRRHAFEPEKTVTLDGDRLVLSAPGQPSQTLPLARVSRIRLAFEPTRVQDGLYTCRIWAKGGMSPWVILHSQNYRGILDFEDRRADYRKFVSLLNNALVTYSPRAAFEAGTGVGKYILNVGVLALSLVGFAAVVIITQGEGWSETTWAKFWLVLPLVPLAVLWIKRNRPRTYDPKGSLGELLPSG